MENNQSVQQNVPINPEVLFMQTAKEMVANVMEAQVQMNKANVESEEKIEIKAIESSHTQVMFIYKIIIAIALIGGISGIYLCIQPESRNIGVTLISSTITGILGFLGGKAVEAKG